MRLDQRVLILASTRRDAEATEHLLKGAGLTPFVCEGFERMVQEIDTGAGCLLIAKEVLGSQNLDLLSEKMAAQPSWSDLPLVVLTSTGDITQGKAETARLLRKLRNATVLERPVRVATLTSVLESLVADRVRQYEVRDLLQKLELAKEESDRANRAKSEFLANMSHEIRTPLGAMLGFADLAFEGQVTPEERHSYMEAVRRNGQLLLALVNDILDLSKVEAGKIELEEIETYPGDVLLDVISSLKPQADQKKIELVAQIEGLLTKKVLTDPVRLKQILINIVGNAVKFTREGRVLVKMSSSPAGEGGELLTIDVVDTGLGISDDQRKKLFKPFSQADSSTTRAYGGTGLGLVLSRQLARALGGDLLLAESTPGKGSMFRITLKVGKFREVSPAAAGTRAAGDPANGITGLKVLLVEDSPDNRFLISRFLKSAGVSVETASDGQEGMERATRKDYDVVLMDMQMPVLDGNEATIRLRRQGYAKPIIALTAHALKGDRERALKAGFDDYLTKPIQRTALIETLDRISRRGRGPEPRPTSSL